MSNLEKMLNFEDRQAIEVANSDDGINFVTPRGKRVRMTLPPVHHSPRKPTWSGPSCRRVVWIKGNFAISQDPIRGCSDEDECPGCAHSQDQAETRIYRAPLGFSNYMSTYYTLHIGLATGPMTAPRQMISVASLRLANEKNFPPSLIITRMTQRPVSFREKRNPKIKIASSATDREVVRRTLFTLSASFTCSSGTTSLCVTVTL